MHAASYTRTYKRSVYLRMRIEDVDDHTPCSEEEGAFCDRRGHFEKDVSGASQNKKCRRLSFPSPISSSHQH